MKDEESGNRLGGYLRARRELVSPAQAGLPPGGNRRVPGLRREEVALLAGISPDYYPRLERGLDKNPSPQVLESLARPAARRHRADVPARPRGGPPQGATTSAASTEARPRSTTPSSVNYASTAPLV
ncbi:helix-turn-helix domain-containing protein [Streptosporangium pseudovulgare]|nr:helix-turn-helix transcriptional regulator [Streptosporangium pseudovulgare]